VSVEPTAKAKRRRLCSNSQGQNDMRDKESLVGESSKEALVSEDDDEVEADESDDSHLA